MAIVSRKEFAALCGDEVKTLNVYINRKQVIMHDAKGKQIDTNDAVNLLYRKNRETINKAKKEAAELVSHVKSVPFKGPAPDTDEEEAEEESEYNHRFLTKVAIEDSQKKESPGYTENPVIIKLKKDTELVALKIQKEQILLDKAAGKLIPIDVAASLLQSQAKAIFSNFDNAIENIAGIYCQIMANGDMAYYTKIVDEGKRALSNAIERAGIDADKDLDTILTTFSQSNTNRML